MDLLMVTVESFGVEDGILIIFIHVSHQDLLICLTSHPKTFLFVL